MEIFWRDLRFGVRMLMKSPGMTAISVVTLALGIGANTVVFSVAYAVMWRELPYQRPEQLVMVWERSTREKMVQPSMNATGMFLAWREHGGVFSDVAAYEDASISHRSRFFLTAGSEPERIKGALVSSNLFSMLGVDTVIGRTFTDEDERPGEGQVVILSDAFWRRRFSGDPGVIGRKLGLNDRVYTVVGVAPPDFRLSYPNATDLWVPFTFGPKERADMDGATFKVMARLKPGVTIEQAREGMTLLTRRLKAPHVRSVKDLYVQLDPLHEYHFGETRRPLQLLLFAVAAVLLIACVNVANLMLAGALNRSRELVVRAATGASRGRLVRQMLTENMALAALGGVTGLAIAFWVRNLLLDLAPDAIPRISDVKIDAWAMGFTALLTISAGVISGLAPALQASRPDPGEALKSGAATVQPSQRRLRDGLVIAETALILMLLIGAGLMIRSLWRLNQVELGFDPGSVLTMQYTIPDYRYPPITRESWPVVWAGQRALIERIIDRVKATPGVVTAAAASSLPMSGSDGYCGFSIAGKSGNGYGANCRYVSNDYFRAMGIKLLKGRLFTGQDTGQSGNVVVVTDEFVKRYFPNEEPLGQRLDPSDWNAEIVGVIADVRHKPPAHAIEPAYYVPLSQSTGFRPVSLVVRTMGDPSLLASAIRRAVWAEDGSLPLEEVATLERISANAVADTRFISVILGALGLIALMLGATGIYGVTAYNVAQRTREIGVRMALGAQPADVLRIVVRRGLWLALAGIVIGLTGSLWLTGLLSGLLFGVSSTDPLTYIAIVFLLMFVSALACFIPARRAAGVDPMIALRCE